MVRGSADRISDGGNGSRSYAASSTACSGGETCQRVWRLQPARLGEYDSTVISSREPRRGDAAMSMLDGESISAALRSGSSGVRSSAISSMISPITLGVIRID